MPSGDAQSPHRQGGPPREASHSGDSPLDKPALTTSEDTPAQGIRPAPPRHARSGDAQATPGTPQKHPKNIRESVLTQIQSPCPNVGPCMSYRRGLAPIFDPSQLFRGRALVLVLMRILSLILSALAVTAIRTNATLILITTPTVILAFILILCLILRLHGCPAPRPDAFGHLALQLVPVPLLGVGRGQLAQNCGKRAPDVLFPMFAFAARLPRKPRQVAVVHFLSHCMRAAGWPGHGRMRGIVHLKTVVNFAFWGMNRPQKQLGHS